MGLSFWSSSTDWFFGGYFQTKTMLCRLVPKDKKLLARSFCISAGFPGAGVAQDICNDF